MSEKRIAASTPSLSIGCSVTSAASSGVRQTVRKSVLLAHRPVLGQITSGLAHDPDRRTLDRLAPAGPEKQIVHHPSLKSTLAMVLSCMLEVPS